MLPWPVLEHLLLVEVLRQGLDTLGDTEDREPEQGNASHNGEEYDFEEEIKQHGKEIHVATHSPRSAALFCRM
jgi:hypothetical protein